MREAGNFNKYDKTKVFEALKTATGKWSLFGGEALLLPLPELEELLKLGKEKWNYTGVQTNGTLITDRHIELFTTYQTHVGISMDGPGELNDSRWAGTLKATRKTTKLSEAALDKLIELGNKQIVPCPSLIITIHAGNASTERWPRMLNWLRELDKKGLKYINFHVMEMDHEADKLYLPHDQLKKVMVDLWDLADSLTNLKFANFKEIIDLLEGKDNEAMCVWHACDPWNTSAVQGIEGDGSPSKCSRTNKDGVDWLPGQGAGETSRWQIGNFEGQRFHERQLSLYVTPQSDGGCKDCRFWLMCQGQCPGTGEKLDGVETGDWRLRSSYCQTWKDMFEEGEKKLIAKGITPISIHTDREKVEKILYQAWVDGKSCSMSQGFESLKTGNKPVSYQLNSGHGDHTDANHGDHHGDSYSDLHGDDHGDRIQNEIQA